MMPSPSQKIKPKPYCANKDARRRVKKRLTSCLEVLEGCCKPLDRQRWPSPDLLESVEHCVMSLIATERAKFPSPKWAAFCLLHNRERKLRLVSHVDNLIKRARDRLEEAGESVLSKLARQSGDDAQKLLRDIECLRKNLSGAKATDWRRHESALKRLSPGGKLELACGTHQGGKK
jgi:hypothetical protein